MTLSYQRFTAVLLLIYGSLFLSGIYYCLRVFWCAAVRMSELELVTICPDLLERQDDILGHVITGDETWVYQYGPETKRQSAQWKTANSPRPKKFRRSESRVKTILLTFFDSRGFVHYEFVPTANSQPSLLFGSNGKAA